MKKATAKHPLQELHEKAVAATPEAVVTQLPAPEGEQKPAPKPPTRRREPQAQPASDFDKAIEEARAAMLESDNAVAQAAATRSQKLEKELDTLKTRVQQLGATAERTRDAQADLRQRVDLAETAIKEWPDRLSTALANFGEFLLKRLKG